MDIEDVYLELVALMEDSHDLTKRDLVDAIADLVERLEDEDEDE